MFDKIKKKINYTVIFIFLSFGISLIISNYYLNKYDKYTTYKNLKSFHQMIKTDSYRYMSHGAEIKKDLSEGKNFFETGRQHFTKYLPPRIAAAYYYFFKKDLFNNFEDKKINIGIHFPYMLIQSLIYYLSVFFLYSVINNKMKAQICFPIIMFLCIEPTIFQYHGTFWSETYFFSLQIILLALIIKNKIDFNNFLLIGFILSLLSLQRQTAYFFIIFIIFYYLFFLDKKSYYKILYILFSFFIIQLIVGYNNYVRDGKFYILTSDTRTAVYHNFADKIITRGENISEKEFKKKEIEIALNWIEENSAVIDKQRFKELSNKIKNSTTPFKDVRATLVKEQDIVKYDDFYASRTIKLIQEYPIITFKMIIKNSIHSILLNPFHIYSDHNFPSGEIYYLSSTHKKLIPFRIAYSIFIYAISLMGFYYLIKEGNKKIIFILLISIIYNYGMISWHGNTRYFVPVLIYLSFFFGYGIKNLPLFKKL